MMVILHIASIDNSKTSGVCVAVLKHVEAQGRLAETAIINVNGILLSEVKRQLPYTKAFDIHKLPFPFNRPDLVVFHECYRPEYLGISKDLRKNNIPYVIVPHGELREEAQRKKHLKKMLANFLLFNCFINHAAALQCLSENEIKSTHFGNHIFLGTNGTEIPNTAKDSFHEEGAVFIYIGRYEWQVKGLDLLFDAIKKEAAFLRGNHCRFLLYGPDIYGRFATVSSMVREREICDLVSLQYEIVGTEKQDALLDADIFIQTSRHEGMPIGILEAMSYGLPCLVTEGTSLGAEIANDRAGWVARTDADSIAACIVKAIEDRKQWKILGCNGRNAVKEHFSWQMIAEKALMSYKEILFSCK